MILDHSDGTTVGIKLSGGADSSILYYAFCKKYADNPTVNIVPISLDTNLKPYYVMHAERIVTIVEKITGKKPLDHLKVKIKHGTKRYIVGQENLLIQASEKYNINPYHFYSGLTKNPERKDMLEFFQNNSKKLGLELEEIKEQLYNKDYSRDGVLGTNDGYRPFGSSDKKAVAEFYKEHDAMEIIYPYTNSCEAFGEKIIDEYGYPKHCGYCFHCCERWYGFGRII